MTARPFDRVQATDPSRARVDFEAVASAARNHARAVCNRIVPGGKVVGGEYVVRNPKRSDKRPGSFKVNLRTGRWCDFATGDGGGDLIALVAWRYDLSQVEAARRLASLLSIPFKVTR